jgi:hypothetical protein
MKRILVVLILVGIIVGLPMSLTFAGKGKGPAPKVDICHITPNYGTSEPFTFFGNDVVANYGHIVSVSENAAEAHYAHGDPKPVFLTEDWSFVIPEFDNDSECVIFVDAP